jgi:hypothetical protein
LVEVHSVEKSQGTRRCLGHRVGHVPLRPSDTLVVERDHPPIHSQLIDQCGVPVVEIASEVLQQNNRTPLATGVAVGEAQSSLGLHS